MQINITYDNGLAKTAENLAGSIGAIIEAGARRVCEIAKSVCPVDTGTLRESISAECDGNRAEISANTDYASYVEFGTSQMAPQPYLVPSLIEHSDSVLEAMARAIESI